MFAVKVKIIGKDGKSVGDAGMEKQYATKANAVKLANKVEAAGLMAEVVEL